MEYINQWVRSSKDPLYFINVFCKINDQPLHLTNLQEDIVLNVQSNNWSITKNNQTFVVAAYMLWFAMFNKDKVILSGSHTFANATKMSEYVKMIYDSLPDWMKNYNKMTTASNRKIDFDSKSVIKFSAITDSYGKGQAVHLVCFDDMSEINIDDEIIISMLQVWSVTNTRIIMMSECNNLHTNLFDKIYKAANNFTADDMLYGKFVAS